VKLFRLLIGLLFAVSINAATEFVATVYPDATGSALYDYKSLALAETGLQNDLTAATIKVFSITSPGATVFASGNLATGLTSLATCVIVLEPVTKTQILVKTIVGTLQSGETLQGQGATKNVILNDAGDSPVISIACYAGTQADTSLTFSGWTTGVSNYINVYTSSGEGHAGIYTTSKYRIENASNPAITISEEYVRLTGIQAAITAMSSDNKHVITISGIEAGNDIKINRCIIKHVGTDGYYGSGLRALDTDIILDVRNSLVFNIGTTNHALNSGIHLNCFSATINNCTLIGGKYALISIGGTITATNVYCGGAFTTNYSGTITMLNCASSDGSGSGGALANIPVSTANFVNVTPGSENYHLVAGSGLLNVGTDLSMTFTTDIDGETRSGTWDIGADDYNVTNLTTNILRRNIGTTRNPSIRHRR
jgi:hypothetical protein